MVSISNKLNHKLDVLRAYFIVRYGLGKIYNNDKK